MKVICVHKGPWGGKFVSTNLPAIGYFEGPKYNEVCTVIDEDEEGRYQLENYPNNYWYSKKYFRELSDSTIDELLEELELDLEFEKIKTEIYEEVNN